MGKATRIDAGGYGRGGDPLHDSRFSSHEKSDAAGDGRMLEVAVATAAAEDIANAVEAAGPGAPEPEVQREIEIALRRREEIRWGRSNADVGGRAPNGERFDTHTSVAPGIDFMGTPGHGYYCLSPERNKAIAPALRNRSGRYEEDCEQYIVAWTFPDAFPKNDHDADAQGVRNWFPDGWEKATGQTLTPGESHGRDEANWTQAHAADYVVTTASRDGDSHVIVNARAGATGDVKRFRVSRDDYDAAHAAGDVGRRGRFVIDLDRHDELAVPERTLTPVPQYTGINVDGATPAARKLIEKDLATRVRGGGTIATVIAGGLSGKTVFVDDSGKREYYLCLSQNREESARMYKVTKATWSALEALDSRTETQKVVHEIHALEPAIAKAKEEMRVTYFGYGSGRAVAARENVAKLEARQQALREKLAAASAAEDAAK